MNIDNRKITLVAGLHGNEKMPVKALLQKKIDFIHGNPLAFKRNVRFTAKDLNASFGTRNNSYESKRAAVILKKIKKNALVVDFHSTENEKRPFAILVDRKMLPFAATTGLKLAVVMKHNIKKGHALINYRDGISVEAGTHLSRKSFDTTLKIVSRLRENKTGVITAFEVYDIIKKPGRYTNFKKHKEGFYPVLANEPEYESLGIFGLKAKKLSR